MKLYYLTVGFIFLIGIQVFMSCKKVELTQFEMDFEETITIEAGTPLNVVLDMTTPNIETKYQEVFETYNTKRELIEEISLKSLKFQINTPSSGNFNFLESAEFKLSANGEETDAIATIVNSEENTTELMADTSGDNIKDFLTIDEFGIKVSLITDEVLTEDYELKISFVFFVDAKVLGQGKSI